MDAYRYGLDAQEAAWAGKNIIAIDFSHPTGGRISMQVSPLGENAPRVVCLYVFVHEIPNLSRIKVFLISCHEPVTATSLVENECRQP